MGAKNYGKVSGVSDPPTPLQRVYLVLALISERMAWLPTAVAGACAVGAAYSFAMAGDPPDIDNAAIFWGVVYSVAGIVLSVAAEIWRHSARASLRREISSARVFMVDALDPIAVEIARMPKQTKRQRENQLAKLVGNASASIPVSLPEAVNLRVIVYSIRNTPGKPEELVVMNHIGRKDKPGRVMNEPGTRGEHIFASIYEAESVIEPDVPNSTRPGVEKEGKRYGAFISCPIVADDIAFGMLSVDSPMVGSLDDNDVAVIELMASMLSIAFAEANRP